MKKIVGLLIIAIFVFSLVPLAIADRLKLDSEVDLEVTSSGSSDDSKISSRNSASIKAQLSENLTRAEKMREKNEERLQKIAELDRRQIERLSKLEIKNLEKIGQLKKERLERLAELSDEKLERIAELDKEKLEKISDLNGSDIQKFSSLNRARLKELAKLDIQALKMELKAIHVLKVRNSHDLDERKLTKAEIAKAKEDFEDAKERFEKSKDALKEAREDLKEAKEKRDANATIQSSKAYLLNASDVLISHLEKLKAKIQESENIEANLSARIAAEIDGHISAINSIKAEVQAATTKEQIKEAAAKLRKEWNSIQHISRIHTGRIVAARVEGVVNQGLVLEKRLDHTLAQARDKNISVNVTAEMNLFSSQIAASRDKYLQAQAKISQAFELRVNGEPADSSQIKNLMEQANQLLKESRDLIQQAHQTLKVIVKKIKDAYPDARLSDETEVEIEEED